MRFFIPLFIYIYTYLVNLSFVKNDIRKHFIGKLFSYKFTCYNSIFILKYFHVFLSKVLLCNFMQNLSFFSHYQSLHQNRAEMCNILAIFYISEIKITDEDSDQSRNVWGKQKSELHYFWTLKPNYKLTINIIKGRYKPAIYDLQKVNKPTWKKWRIFYFFQLGQNYCSNFIIVKYCLAYHVYHISL